MTCNRKGILVVSEARSCLFPLTHVVSKSLMPVYNKPMIYYPLTVLMLAGITEILVVTNEQESDAYEDLLGNGSQWGISIKYAVQRSNNGLGEALLLAEDFLQGQELCLILGDNLFFGHKLGLQLNQAKSNKSGATIFSYHVADPKNHDVVEFDAYDNVLSLEEKPSIPKSNHAIPGIYFYDNRVVDIVKELVLISKNEFGITSINKSYLRKSELSIVHLSRGITWLDTSTHDSLLEASCLIQSLEKRQGLKIGSPEEISWKLGLIADEQLEFLGHRLKKSGYGQYLLEILKESRRLNLVQTTDAFGV